MQKRILKTIRLSASEYQQYKKQNPTKTRILKAAAKRGVQDYGQTLRKLAAE